MSALDQLLDAARGPLGPPARADFGDHHSGGPWDELRQLLGVCNGFYLANAAIQLFRAGPRGLGPDLNTWNQPSTWKETYGRQADNLFCFAHDLFGVQFAIQTTDRSVVAFDPETAQRSSLGPSLHDWAQWLLDEPDTRTAEPLATAWQHQYGQLDHHQRLVPSHPFILGGSYAPPHLHATDATDAMRRRGPLARQLHRVNNGTHIHLHHLRKD